MNNIKSILFQYLLIRELTIMLFLMFFVCFNLFSQTTLIASANADISGAIITHDSIIGPTNAPQGFGKIQEFDFSENHECFIEKEHHSVWYMIPIKNECDFLFDLIPLKQEDDYDFMLFKKENFSNHFDSKKSLPIRSNKSRNDSTKKSVTGLSFNANSLHVKSGIGINYSKFIHLQKNDTLLLLIDNVYDNGDGHIIRLYFRNIIKRENIPPNYFSIRINTFNQDSVPIVTKAILLLDKDSIYSEQNSIHTIVVKKDNYSLRIKKKGYLSFGKALTANDSMSEEIINVYMHKIEKNTYADLKNVFFYAGKSIFLPDSYVALKALLECMNDNPMLKIEIRGHVNMPYNTPQNFQRSTQHLFSLSQDRSRAVCDYLVKRGIDRSRIRFKGMSNTQMLFPYATTEKQHAANRRVEIKILKIGN